MNLKECRAVVTGASSGIGEEYARQLAQKGAELAIVARRKDRLDALAKELQEKYQARVTCIPMDLCEEGACEKLASQFSMEKPVDLLVNNAGMGSFGDFLDRPLSSHLKTIQLNVTALTELSYRFAEHMLKHGRMSRIVNISSVTAFQSVPHFAVYSGTKSYVLEFSNVMDFELRNSNVSVQCVCPGGTYTEFLDAAGEKLKDSGHKTMMSAEEVVRLSIEGMLRGDSTTVTGWMNRVSAFLPRIFPRKVALHLAQKVMDSAVEQVPEKKE